MTPKEREAVSIQNESETVSSLSMMRTAMQQALEALGCYNSKHRHTYGLDGAWDEEITKGEKAITAMREVLDHSGEVNEMVGCAYCNNPLFAGTKCNNCGLVTLAEQAEPNSTFMEGYRIGLAEMREKCAKVCEPIEGSAYEVCVYKTMQTLAAAVRARSNHG